MKTRTNVALLAIGLSIAGAHELQAPRRPEAVQQLDAILNDTEVLRQQQASLLRDCKLNTYETVSIEETCETYVESMTAELQSQISQNLAGLRAQHPDLDRMKATHDSTRSAYDRHIPGELPFAGVLSLIGAIGLLGSHGERLRRDGNYHR